MYIIQPYVKHFEEVLPAEEGEVPEFWSVFSCAMPLKNANVSTADNAIWLADFSTIEFANQFVSCLKSDEINANAANVEEGHNISDDSNELGSMAVGYLASALNVGIAFVQSNYPGEPSSDPLDFCLFWDPHDKGLGIMAVSNLGEEMLDTFRDGPAYYRPAMPAAISSLRKLADQIEAIYLSAPIEDEVWPKFENEALADNTK